MPAPAALLLSLAALPLLLAAAAPLSARQLANVVKSPDVHHDGFIYSYVDTKMTWLNARNYCSEQWHGNLVSVHSDDDNLFVRDLWTQHTSHEGNTVSHVWLGLSDIEGEDVFRWSDGSSLDYYMWAVGEPNSAAESNEDCVEMYVQKQESWANGDHRWNDNPCSDEYSFVCKKPEDPGPCQVSEWSAWGPCSARTCGMGTMERSRTITVFPKQEDGGAESCPPLDDIQPCSVVDPDTGLTKPCSADECKLTPWSAWSPCTAECGTGTRERTRKKQQGTCRPSLQEMEVCNQQECQCFGGSKKCVTFLGGDQGPTKPGFQFGTCPEYTTNETFSPCHEIFQDEAGRLLPSCCANDFIQSVLDSQEYKIAVAAVKTKGCKNALTGAMCMVCSSKQEEFMSWVKNHWSVNICEETCISLWESCKDEQGLRSLLAMFTGNNPLQNAEDVCRWLDNLKYKQFEVDFTPRSKVVARQCGPQGCYLFDNMSPQLEPAHLHPLNNSQHLPAATLNISMVFNEGVSVVAGKTGKVEICEYKDYKKCKPGDQKCNECDETANAILVSDQTKVFVSQTIFPSDTVVIQIHTVAEDGKLSCVLKPSTKYMVRVPAGLFADAAGNAFHGLSGSDEWTFTTGGAPCTKGGSSAAGVVVVLLLALAAGGGFFVWYKKNAQDANYAAPTEGQVVQTADGTHQVRLVPVFAPPSATSAPGAADGNLGLEPSEDYRDAPDLGMKSGLANLDSLAAV